jgi:hypothetical protein
MSDYLKQWSISISGTEELPNEIYILGVAYNKLTISTKTPINLKELRKLPTRVFKSHEKMRIHVSDAKKFNLTGKPLKNNHTTIIGEILHNYVARNKRNLMIYAKVTDPGAIYDLLHGKLMYMSIGFEPTTDQFNYMIPIPLEVSLTDDPFFGKENKVLIQGSNEKDSISKIKIKK